MDTKTFTEVKFTKTAIAAHRATQKIGMATVKTRCGIEIGGIEVCKLKGNAITIVLPTYRDIRHRKFPVIHLTEDDYADLVELITKTVNA